MFSTTLHRFLILVLLLSTQCYADDHCDNACAAFPLAKMQYKRCLSILERKHRGPHKLMQAIHTMMEFQLEMIKKLDDNCYCKEEMLDHTQIHLDCILEILGQ